MSGHRDPFTDLIVALDDDGHDSDDIVRVDPLRRRRTGVPEVVLAEGKDDDAVVKACRRLLLETGRVAISRIERERAERIAAALPEATLEQPFPGRTVVLALPGAKPPQLGGFVGILTAGTSDLGVAGEAAVVVQECGCRVELAADVGVAGLHRLVQPLRRFVAGGVDVIVVAAGMDGALPSVVAGLVDVPVIGLPTSVGYGIAAGGSAALGTMLATCSPGLVVVNVDNGVGAGAAAARIALRARRAGYARD